jgi:allantoinase
MPQIRQAETRTRDLLGYAGAPPDPHWPGGARVAVSIVVNFEEGAELSISDGDPENEAVYEIEQRLAGRPDPAIDSHFEYGSRAGWWRIMEVLGQHGAPATVSSSGRAVERLPLLAQMPCAAATRFRPMAGAGKGTPIWMRPRNATASHAPWRR